MGVGKTYTWTSQLANLRDKVQLSHYAYVSLFGVNSLDALKFAIFENTITLSGGIRSADVDTLDAFIAQAGAWRKLTRAAQSIPFVKNFVGGDVPALLSFMMVRNQIICIDDFERRGKGLELSDVFGLISFLREQRNCKIVVLLNDEQLGTYKREFEQTLEKVVDISIAFSPSPAEFAAIALPKAKDLSGHRDYIIERCIRLGITNIRVIKRIVRSIEQAQPLLAGYDPDLVKMVIRSLVLFCWSIDQPDEAPSIDFIKKKANDPFGLGLREPSDISPKEVAWNALLEGYRYVFTGELDLVLIESVQNGYFDQGKFRDAAAKINLELLQTKGGG